MTRTTLRCPTTPGTIRVVGHEFLDLAAATAHADAWRARGLRVWSKDGVVAVVIEDATDEDDVRAHAHAAGGVTTGR